jgi:hypothetical protein
MVGVKGKTTASLLAAGQTVPPPQFLRALIDTGTDISAIAPPVLSQLRLGSFQQHTTQTLSGPVSIQLFEISLTIPQTARSAPPLLVLDQLIVMALPTLLPGVDALLGLDVLDHLLLIVDGPRGEITISD